MSARASRLDGMNRRQRQRFARTYLYGHREVRRNSVWIGYLTGLAARRNTNDPYNRVVAR